MGKKNQVVEDNYDEDQEKANLQDTTEETEEVEKKAEGELYTYVGAGEAPPRRIHFMGKQVFTRGVATAVSNPDVLAKLPGHPCFVKGEVSMDDLHDADEEANKDADKQRQKDARLNATVKKNMAQWGKKGEAEEE